MAFVMLLLVTGTWEYVILKGGILLQLEPGPKDRKKEGKDNENVWKGKAVFFSTQNQNRKTHK